MNTIHVQLRSQDGTQGRLGPASVYFNEGEAIPDTDEPRRCVSAGSG